MSDKIKTFRDLTEGDNGSHSEDDDKPTYYAGGERSGVAVHGPNKDGDKKDDSLVNRILKQSAEGHTSADFPTSSSSSSSTTANRFHGAGYRLGTEEEDLGEPSKPVEGTSSISQQDEIDLDKVVTRTLTFWRNGFSIEDGPLHSYNDPENKRVLEAIHSGVAPPELFGISRGQAIEIHVSRKLEEDYKEPPKKLKPFSGTGNRLGDYSSVSSNINTSSSSTSQSQEPVIEADESLPITSIQIRLIDGTRFVAKLNHTHTVNDLYNLVKSKLSSNDSNRQFALWTNYPLKELKDRNLTIKDAGLLNAALSQKWI